jgi:hypothetical protein
VLRTVRSLTGKGAAVRHASRSVVLELVDASLDTREPDVITVTMRTASRRQRKMKLSLQAARDLVAQLDYCVWKGSRAPGAHHSD